MTTINGLDPYAALNGGGSTVTANEAGAADRFLKLLVAQMQNQDPLNPMDNAQVTSQMAQISTVNGIETLNTTVQSLNGQFVQLQALQGASLVGREITLYGDNLRMADDGTATGTFELAGSADRVKVEILGPAGHVVDTLELGAQGKGRHDFDWTPPAGFEGSSWRFRVSPTAGTVQVPVNHLTHDVVNAVSVVGDRLVLETQHSGDIYYHEVRAVN